MAKSPKSASAKTNRIRTRTTKPTVPTKRRASAAATHLCAGAPDAAANPDVRRRTMPTPTHATAPLAWEATKKPTATTETASADPGEYATSAAAPTATTAVETAAPIELTARAKLGCTKFLR